MKNLTLLFGFILFISLSLNGQSENKYEKHVESIDAIITSLYQVISGDKGVKRDWDLFNTLFHEEAKMMPIMPMKDRGFKQVYISAAEYIESNGNQLVELGFHEVEIHREVDKFGQLAHVFTSYEAFVDREDDTPIMTGINSIQLYHDGARWWISNIAWLQATEDNPIPEKYRNK